MLFTFRRITKIIFIILLIAAAITISQYVKNFNSWRDLLWGNHKIQTVKTHNIQILTPKKTLTLKIEEARTDETRSNGLMNRTSLCEDCAMVFYYTKDVQDGYWMKNCKIPLDIIFVNNEFEIVDIKKDFEPCNTDNCPIYTPISSFRYAIEVNGGYYDEHEINIGNTIVGI